MNFDYNPRTNGGRRIDDFATPKKLATKKHFKSSKLGRLGEQATLKGPAGDSIQLGFTTGVSTRARNTLGMFLGLQILYTSIVIILVAMQTNTISLAIGDVVGIMVVQNALTVLVFGMHTKVQSRADEGEEQTANKTAFLQLIRNDRRTMLFFLGTIISCAATIDIVYIASIAPSMTTKADSFRETGQNNYVHRAIDMFETLVFALSLPLLLTLIAEGHWACKSLQHRVAAKNAQADDNDDDDDENERVTPRSIRTIK